MLLLNNPLVLPDVSASLVFPPAAPDTTFAGLETISGRPVEVTGLQLVSWGLWKGPHTFLSR